MQHPRQQPTGFTLFESLIALTIGIALFGALMSVYTLSSRSLSQGEARAELTHASRALIGRIAMDVRQAEAIVSELPDSAGSETDELWIEDGHSASLQYIRYYLDETDMYRQVVRYYFSSEPEVAVPYDAEDAFGNPPQSSTVEDYKIGHYINDFNVYGTTVVTVQLTLTHAAATHTTRTALYAKNF